MKEDDKKKFVNSNKYSLNMYVDFSLQTHSWIRTFIHKFFFITNSYSKSWTFSFFCLFDRMIRKKHKFHAKNMMFFFLFVYSCQHYIEQFSYLHEHSIVFSLVLFHYFLLHWIISVSRITIYSHHHRFDLAILFILETEEKTIEIDINFLKFISSSKIKLSMIWSEILDIIQRQFPIQANMKIRKFDYIFICNRLIDMSSSFHFIFFWS